MSIPTYCTWKFYCMCTDWAVTQKASGVYAANTELLMISDALQTLRGYSQQFWDMKPPVWLRVLVRA